MSMVTLDGERAWSLRGLKQQGHSSLLLMVSHLLQQGRHTRFPHNSSIGLSSMSMHMMHVCMCVLGKADRESEAGKKEAGAMAARLAAISKVLVLGLPVLDVAVLPPPVARSSKCSHT